MLEKSVAVANTYCSGLVVVIRNPFAPLVPPVIISPLWKVPVIVPVVKVGATAFVPEAKDS